MLGQWSLLGHEGPCSPPHLHKALPQTWLPVIALLGNLGFAPTTHGSCIPSIFHAVFNSWKCATKYILIPKKYSSFGVYWRSIVFFKHWISKNTSSLAHSRGCRQPDWDGVSSPMLAGKCQTLLLEKTKENSKLDLALVQPWTRPFVLCVEKPLTGTGNVPNFWCCKEEDLTQGAAGDRWQQQVDLSGLASGTVWCSPGADLA